MADRTEHLPKGVTGTSEVAEVVCNRLADQVRRLTDMPMSKCELRVNDEGEPVYVSHGEAVAGKSPVTVREANLAGSLAAHGALPMVEAAIADGFARIDDGKLTIQNDLPLVKVDINSGLNGSADISVQTFGNQSPQFSPTVPQKPGNP